MVDAYENTSNVNEWGETSRGPWKRGIISFLNNTFIRNSRNSALNIGGASAENSYISINNIIDGGAGHSSIFRSNNLYTGLGWSQSPAYNWSLSAGEFVNEDLSVIFANPAAQNYRLAPGSPAINAGADITPYLPRAVFPEFDFTRDIEGKVRTGHHIGAYGYQ
jgi:hypothetical protein